MEKMAACPLCTVFPADPLVVYEVLDGDGVVCEACQNHGLEHSY